ncbi:hypothetical protein ANN_07664 [Periplaneta americana]|uniref:Uncharacterized protein n=1 Tax=Periplaneta americana TaxID=6978 RepID=A0ABQ8SZ97_PERAM|nr:hypothetical protein ANN_07664 [Periplaneta americana]
MNERNVRKWCEMFNNGRTNVHDETRPRRPSLITEDLKTKVNDRILQDRRTSLDELHIAFPDISRSLLGENVSQHLGYHKICARWVPRQLSDQHKTQRMASALTFLMRYHTDGDAFLDQIVTGDETWVSHNTPETKRQSRHWHHPSSPKKPRKFKYTLSTQKVMATVFWDRKGVLLLDFMPKGTTINANRYCETLRKLRRVIQNKRRECFREEFPDLAPSDFHLFTKLNDFLGGTRFGSDEELKKTVNTWLNELAAEEYNTGILKLVNRYDKCLNVSRSLFGVIYRFSYRSLSSGVCYKSPSVPLGTSELPQIDVIAMQVTELHSAVFEVEINEDEMSPGWQIRRCSKMLRKVRNRAGNKFSIFSYFANACALDTSIIPNTNKECFTRCNNAKANDETKTKYIHVENVSPTMLQRRNERLRLVDDEKKHAKCNLYNPDIIEYNTTNKEVKPDTTYLNNNYDENTMYSLCETYGRIIPVNTDTKQTRYHLHKAANRVDSDNMQQGMNKERLFGYTSTKTDDESNVNPMKNENRVMSLKDALDILQKASNRENEEIKGCELQITTNNTENRFVRDSLENRFVRDSLISIMKQIKPKAELHSKFCNNLESFELLKQNCSLKKELEAAFYERKASEAHIRRLQAENCHYKNVIEDKDTEVTSLKEEIIILSENLQQARSVLDRTTLENKKLKIALQNEKNKIQTLIEKETTLTNLVEFLKEGSKMEVKALNNDYAKEKLDLISRIQEMETSLEQYEHTTACKLKEQEETLQLKHITELTILKEQLAENLLQVEEIKYNLNRSWEERFNKYRTEMMSHISDLEKQVTDLTDKPKIKNEELLNDIQNLRSHISAISLKLENCRKQYETESDENKKVITALTQEVHNKTKENSELLSNIAERKKLIDVLQNTVSVQCEERSNIDKKIEELKSQVKKDTSDFKTNTVKYIHRSSPRKVSEKILSNTASKDKASDSSKPVRSSYNSTCNSKMNYITPKDEKSDIPEDKSLISPEIEPTTLNSSMSDNNEEVKIEEKEDKTKTMQRRPKLCFSDFTVGKGRILKNVKTATKIDKPRVSPKKSWR